MIDFTRQFEIQRKRELRGRWWLGFICGLLVAATVLFLLEPAVTGQWQLY